MSPDSYELQVLRTTCACGREWHHSRLIARFEGSYRFLEAGATLYNVPVKTLVVEGTSPACEACYSDRVSQGLTPEPRRSTGIDLKALGLL